MCLYICFILGAEGGIQGILPIELYFFSYWASPGTPLASFCKK